MSGTLADVMVAPEVRAYSTRMRDVESSASGRYLEGMAVPYGEWADIGYFREQFQRGAFAKSIRESAAALPLLLFHDSRSFPVGKAHRWTETDEGLVGVWQIDEADALAMEAHRKAAEGYLSGLSVGFQPIINYARAADTGGLVLDQDGQPIDLANLIEHDPVTGMMSVTRREARLLETSLTPIPAYAGAGTPLVRSAWRTSVAAPASERVREARAWLDGRRRR